MQMSLPGGVVEVSSRVGRTKHRPPDLHKTDRFLNLFQK